MLLWNNHSLPDHFPLTEWKLKASKSCKSFYENERIKQMDLLKNLSGGTLIILASIIFSFFQIKPWKIDKGGWLPFPLPAPQPRMTHGLVWGPTSKGSTKEPKEGDASPLFLSKCWPKISQERLKLVRMWNSLYLANFIFLYLLSSSAGCHSLRLSKNKCYHH